MKKKAISMLLAICLIFSICPAITHAEELEAFKPTADFEIQLNGYASKIIGLKNDKTAVLIYKMDNSNIMGYFLSIYDNAGNVILNRKDITSMMDTRYKSMECQVYALSNGNILVTYNKSDAGGANTTLGTVPEAHPEAYFMILNPTGEKVVSQVQINTENPGSSLTRAISVTELSNGNLAFSWQRNDNSSIATRIFTMTGTPVTQEVLVNSGYNAYRSFVSANSNGTYMVCYDYYAHTETPATFYGKYSIFGNDGTPAVSGTVYTSTSELSTVNLLTLSNGNFAAIAGRWGSAQTVYLFNAAGVAQGSYTISSGTPGWLAQLNASDKNGFVLPAFDAESTKHINDTYSAMDSTTWSGTRLITLQQYDNGGTLKKTSDTVATGNVYIGPWSDDDYMNMPDYSPSMTLFSGYSRGVGMLLTDYTKASDGTFDGTYTTRIKLFDMEDSGPSIAVAAQSGPLSALSDGTATFAVTTSSFTNNASLGTGNYSVTWYTDAAGTQGASQTAPSGVTLTKTNAGLLTVTTDSTAQAGTYYFKLTAADASVTPTETATSGVVTLTIGRINATDDMKTAAANVSNLGKNGATVTLPALPAGASYGTPTYAGNVVCSNASASGTTLTFDAAASTAGQTGTITVPVTGATNYNNYNITVTITSVEKTAVTISGLTAQNGTYSGSAVSGLSGAPIYAPAGFSGTLNNTYYLADGTTKTNTANSGAAAEGAAPVNAGSYKVTVSIPENDATYTGSATLAFTIAKAPVSFTVSANTFDYDAVAHTATVAQTASETPSAAGKYTVTYQKGTETAAASETNVGEYQIMVALNDSNLKFLGQADDVRSLTLTEKLTIRAVAYSGITWPTAGSLTYGAALSASTLTGGVGTGTFAWETGTTVPTVSNSGYVVVFTPTDTNYAPVEQNVSVIVAPKALTISGAAATTRAYDGTTDITVTGGTLQGVVGSDEVSLVSTNASGSVTSADAGTAKAVTVTGYTLNGAAASNYTLTQPTDVTVTISQAVGSAAVTMAGWTYGGNASEPVPTSATNGTTGVTYSYAGRNGTSYSASATKPTAAGDYTVTATFPAGTNYQSTTAAANFTVIKKPVTALWTETTKTYTGAAQKPTLALSGVVNGDTLTVSCESHTNAGTYTLTATLDGADKGSYTLVNGNAGFTIQKAPVSFTVADNSKKHTGSALFAAVAATANNANFADFVVTYRNSKGETVANPTEVGNYDIYAAINNANYRHTNSTDGAARKIGVLTIYTTPPATYTASFSGGEGTTGTAPTMDAAIGETVRTLPLNTFNKTGFIFAGWKYDGKTYQAGDAFTQPAGNVTFTAQWTAVYNIDGNVTQKQDDSTVKPVQGATVVLKRGSEIAAATTTDAAGAYNFEGAANSIVPGLYNIEVSYNGIVQTTAVTIADKSVTDANVTLPVGKTNTVVDVKAGTPAMVVDGLNESFTAAKDGTNYTTADAAVVTGGGSVEIKFNAEVTEPETAAKAKIDAALDTVGLYLDLNVQKIVVKIEGSMAQTPQTTPITSSSDLYTATIWLPGNLQGMYSYKVVRLHDYNDGKGTVLDTLTTSPNTYGEYFEVSADKTQLILHVRNFSDYAIGYTAAAPTVPAGSETSAYSITALSASNGTVKPGASSAASGTKVTVTVTPNEGYALKTLTVKDAGGSAVSYTDNKNGTYTFTMPASAVTVSAVFSKIPTSPDVTGVSALLQTVDHIKYISGYLDGAVGPERNMTRGEAAQMFYNLLLEQSAAESVRFSDVADTLWCAKAINKLASVGIIKGYDNGAFGVNDPITREQFCAMAVRFAAKIKTGSVDGTSAFSDVKSGTWSYDSVMTAASLGWINGYSDGSFGPQDNITRAQVVTIVNHMLGRAADKSFVDASAGVKTFSDLSKAHWAYYDLMEAANAHDYKTSGGSETWSALK